MIAAIARFFRGLDAANRPARLPEPAPEEPLPVERPATRHQGAFGGHPDLFATPTRRAALAHHVAMTTHGPAKAVTRGQTAAGYEFTEFTLDQESARR